MSASSVRATDVPPPRDLWAVAIVAAVAIVVLLLPGLLPTIAAVAVAGVAAWAVARFPGVALGALLVLLPVQNIVFGRLLVMGVPPSVLRPMSNLKEFVVVVVAAVAATRVLRGRTQLARVDHVALAYLALLAAYVVVPTVLDPVVGRIFPQAPTGMSPRLQAARTDGLFVVMFLAARHLAASPAWRRRTEIGLIAIGVVIAVAGFVEYFQPDAWQRFVQDWAGVDRYGFEVLGATSALGASTVVPGTDAIRVGSLLLQHLQLGFYLLLPLALAVGRLSRRFTAFDLIAALVVGAAIVMTFTRSAVLAALVTAVLALWALPRDAVVQRLRAAGVAAAVALAGVYLAATTVLAERLGGFFAGTDPSAEGHWQALFNSVALLVRQPAGLGLATAPSVPDRFGARYIVSENAIMQVGVQAGVLTMVVFIVFLIILLRRLLRIARTPGTGVLAGATWTAGIGLLVGAMFLHVLTNIPTSVTYFAAAGLALNRGAYARSD